MDCLNGLGDILGAASSNSYVPPAEVSNSAKRGDRSVPRFACRGQTSGLQTKLNAAPVLHSLNADSFRTGTLAFWLAGCILAMAR